VLRCAAPAGGDEAGFGPNGDGSARAGSGGLDPQRRLALEEQHREGEDEDQAGDDERRASEQSANSAPDPPGAEDRQLGRGGTGQQIAHRDGVLEHLRREPFAVLDA
jgi:hypothetical protein